jgi:hypothetical protein
MVPWPHLVRWARVGGLAATGSNLALWLACGIAAVISGVLFVHAARRRIRARNDR